MKLIVDSGQLLRAADMLRKVIPSKPVLPIMECIRVENTSDYMATLTACDTEHALSILCPMTEITDWNTVCLPGSYLTDALRSIPEQPVVIKIDENLNVTVRHQTGEVSFMAQPADEFPALTDASAAQPLFTIPLDRLITLCRIVPPFSANDELRPVLNGSAIDINPQGLVCVGSDGHRLMKVTLTDVTSAERHSIILPRRSFTLLQQWQKRGSVPVSVSLLGNDCLFSIDGLTLRCRLTEGRYPNYNAVIPLNHDHRVTVDREQLIRSVDSVSSFGSRTSPIAVLQADGDHMNVRAEDLDFSTRAHDTIPVQTNFSNPLSIGFQAPFLTSMLSQFPCQEVTLELQDAQRACVVRYDAPESAMQMTALLMPVTIAS